VRTQDQQIACARCGTILPPLPYDRGRAAGGGLSYRTPLRVGMTARIGGKEFYAVGRIRYVQTEEGETSYWEEWVLLNPDGDARYLEYDEGKWTLSEPFPPGQAPTAGELAGAAEGAGFTVDGRGVTVTDAGACRVQAVEGEIPWPVANGDPVRYVDMEGGNAFYSAELAPDGTVEWFRGQRLNDRAVFTLFDLRELIQALDRREAARGGRRSFGVVCLLAALVALCGWVTANSRGRVVAQGSAPLSAIGQEGARFGPYPLSAVGRVHRLRVSTDLTQSAAWVQAVVENEGAGELFGVSGDFWDETGYDEDGAWHEYNLRARSDFRLARAGNAYVRLYAQPEAAASGATASFVIEEGVLYPTYLGSFAIASFLLSLGFFIAGSPDVGGKVWEGMGAR
jgi:hypothetical protein